MDFNSSLQKKIDRILATNITEHYKYRKIYFTYYGFQDQCKICGKKCKLTVHHLLDKALFPKFKYDPRYMIHLCDECHERCHFHLQNNRRMKEVFKSFIEDLRLLYPDLKVSRQVKIEVYT